MQNILVNLAVAIRAALGLWAFPPLSALVVLLISVVISMISNLVNRRFIDYDRLKRSREEINKYNDMKKKVKQETDPKARRKLELKIKRRERYIMKLQGDVSKQSFVPMLITIVPFILIYTTMNGVFVDPGIAFPGFAIPSPVIWSPLNFASVLGPFGNGFGWQFGQWVDTGLYSPGVPFGGMGLLYIYWYIICSFTMNMVIQKFLGTSMTTGY
ncbi:MAG: EMC3/TMCO1 family protein [Candidatus Hermodarchaeia archaeon]